VQLVVQLCCLGTEVNKQLVHQSTQVQGGPSIQEQLAWFGVAGHFHATNACILTHKHAESVLLPLTLVRLRLLQALDGYASRITANVTWNTDIGRGFLKLFFTKVLQYHVVTGRCGH
jgi:hypothetical protein